MTDLPSTQISCNWQDCPIRSELSGIKDMVTKTADGVNQLNAKLFIGNGLPPLATRLDRIEQAQQRRGKHIWIIYVALVGLIFGVFGDWIKAKVVQPDSTTTIQSIHQKK